MSSPETLFELAARLVNEHESRSSASRLRVIPIVLDDVPQAKHVLHALAAVTEGLLLSADDPEMQSPIVATSNPLVRSAVTTGLKIRRPKGDRGVVIEQLEHLSDVALVDPPTGPAPSPGESALLGLARCVLDERLGQYPFAVMTYSESGMDIEMRRAAWRLIVEQLEGLPLAPLRTLVAVAGGNLTVDPHCQPRRGCIFAVQEGRLLIRKTYDDVRGAASAFANSTAPFTVLFLGAGFSASSKLPLGNSLRDGAIRRLLNLPDVGSSDIPSEEVARRFREFLKGNDKLKGKLRGLNEDEFVRKLTLEQVLVEEQLRWPTLPTLDDFATRQAEVISKPGSSVRDLVALLRRRRGRVVLVTVNFDELVEQAAGEGLVKSFATDGDFEEAVEYLEQYLSSRRDLQVPLFKLHGTIGMKESCVVTIEQTEEGIRGGKLDVLKRLVGSGEQPTPWYYVGVSMRDLDLLPVFMHPDFAWGLDEHWVAPYLEASVEEFAEIRTGQWKKGQGLQERLIAEVSDAFFHEVAAAVSDAPRA